MKNKKIFVIALFLFVLIASMNSVYAIMFKINITGKTKVEVNKSIYLTATLEVWNDVYIPDKPDGGMGKIGSENVTKEVSWTSSNPSIATIDSNGKVTGISSGKVIITAKYDEYRTDTISVTVSNATTEAPKDEITTTIVTSPVITPEIEEEPHDDAFVEIEGEEIYIDINNNSTEIYEVELEEDKTINHSTKNEKNSQVVQNEYSENILIVNDKDSTKEPYESDKEMYIELDNSEFITACITAVVIIILAIIFVVILCIKANKFKKASDKKFILTSIIIAIILLSVILYCKIIECGLLEKDEFKLDSDNKFILDDKGISTIPLGGLGTTNYYFEIDLDNKYIDHRFDSERFKIKDDNSLEKIESSTRELKMMYGLNDDEVNELKEFFIRIKNSEHKSNLDSIYQIPNYYYLLKTKDGEIIIDDEEEMLELKNILMNVDESFGLCN